VGTGRGDFLKGANVNDVKKSIGWADFTWNPVTGCPRGCEYCYAIKIHERFYKTPFSEVVFHPKRLLDPTSKATPSKIFVGSVSDIEYWSMEFLSNILRVCKMCQQHTFMFLSKEERSYNGIKFPWNSMQGITVENPSDIMSWIKIDNNASSEFRPRPFLSIEPIFGPMKYDIPEKYELVIVGAMTGCGKNNVIPKVEWIQSIKDHVPEEKIFWKNNIKKYL
jgi:protein gp37